jgi:ribosomal protein S18 acetylase RimI-like enzyme
MINYVSTTGNISAGQLNGFFVGWPNPPSPETHLRILRNSYRVILAIDTVTDRVVGFINAISDGILSAYLPLLEVLPEYRKRGIGGELVRRMLAEFNDFYMIDLICDPELQPYYEKLGLKKAHGMMIRNYNRQSGRSF